MPSSLDVGTAASAFRSAIGCAVNRFASVRGSMAHFVPLPEVVMRSAFRAFACAAVFAPLIAIAAAPAGQPDPSFGDGDPTRPGSVLQGFDIGEPTAGSWNDFGKELVQDAMGRLVMAGMATMPGGSCVGLMRFTANGLQGAPADAGFGDDGNGLICHANLLGDQADIETVQNMVVLPGGTW